VRRGGGALESTEQQQIPLYARDDNGRGIRLDPGLRRGDGKGTIHGIATTRATAKAGPSLRSG